MSALHFVLPNDIDDPLTPSGGNIYDSRIRGGLRILGWTVQEHAIRGTWPAPVSNEVDRLAQVLSGIPDAATVLLDGLVALAAPHVLAPHASRLRLVILVHMPLGSDGPALSLASAVITTSEWCRRHLMELYDLPPHRVHAAIPGVDPAALVSGSDSGGRLLCVAAVAPHKGQDVLVQALSRVADLPWSCTFVGTLDRDPAFVRLLRQQVHAAGLHDRVAFARTQTGPALADRVTFAGTQTGPALAARYAGADLLILPSRAETYGMVITEALARGIPALTTSPPASGGAAAPCSGAAPSGGAAAGGGTAEALGRAPDGSVPGMLVPAGDPAALGEALRRWLTESDYRRGLRKSAEARRDTLTTWEDTSRLIAGVLSSVDEYADKP